MSRTVRLEIPNPEAMAAFGRRLGRELFPGAVVALVGQLGAGKTFLVRAIAEGLGMVNSSLVSSPTFVLIQEYEARLPVYHFDAYRLHSPAEFADLGAHEYLDGGGVCLIEWADRAAPYLPADRLTVKIAITGESSRSLDVTGHGRLYELLLDRLTAVPPGPARDAD
jgi:tRNA threonylcarbamoyladenosine biosynthesis protein TsaE